MNRARWRFGTAQQQPQQEPATSAPPVTYSADAKRFGFENFGNTCYVNSVIQALYFCAPFRDLMIQEPDRSNPQEYVVHSPQTSAVPITVQPLTPNRRKLERTPSGAPAEQLESLTKPSTFTIPSSPPTLFSALRSLFGYISFHQSEKGTIAPRAFIDKLKEVNEIFRSSMHQDAHEFLNYLLNRIVEEIEEERKQIERNREDLSNSLTTLSSPPTTHAASSNSGTPSQNATLVHKLFEGVLTSETRCLTCETVSSRDESFLDLSIDIEKNSSVTACLRQFSASEMLSQKNKFFCDSCCGLQEAEKRMKIKRLPNVLALHLKRFKYQDDLQKYIKLTYRVAFPFELRLFNTIDDVENADRLYNLFAIVIHIGSGPHHGHYISIIKALGQWFVYDDDNVYSIPEQDISKYFGEANAGSAYVLYYQAADIDLANLGLNSRPSEATNGIRVDFRSVPSRPPSPTTERDTIPSFPPGLSPDVAVDNSQEPSATEPPKGDPDSSQITSPTPTILPSDAIVQPSPTTLPPPSTQSSAANSSKVTVGSWLRRPQSFSRPKTSNGTKKRFDSDQHTPSNDTTPETPRRPATSAGVDNEEEGPKDQNLKRPDSKSGNWFRRRSFKSLEKSKNHDLPPPPPLLKADVGATPVNGSYKKLKPTKSFSNRSNSHDQTEKPQLHSSRPRSEIPKQAHTLDHITNHHSQHHRQHRAGEADNLSPGNSISSYGSTSLTHPLLPAPSISSVQSTSSSSPPTISLSPNRHIPSSLPSSNSSPTVESSRRSQESHGGRRRDNRPLPPVPPSQSDVGTPQHATTEPKGNGNAHERSPTLSVTTLSSSSHAKSPAPNGHAPSAGDKTAPLTKRTSRKLSFTTPWFGRRDKDKH